VVDVMPLAAVQRRVVARRLLRQGAASLDEWRRDEVSEARAKAGQRCETCKKVFVEGETVRLFSMADTVFMECWRQHRKGGVA